MNKDTLLLITSDKMILKIIKSHSCKVTLFRGQDSNLRPLDYETNKLPTAPPRDIILKNTTCFHKWAVLITITDCYKHLFKYK